MVKTGKTNPTGLVQVRGTESAFVTTDPLGGDTKTFSSSRMREKHGGVHCAQAAVVFLEKDI